MLNSIPAKICPTIQINPILYPPWSSCYTSSQYTWLILTTQWPFVHMSTHSCPCPSNMFPAFVTSSGVLLLSVLWDFVPESFLSLLQRYLRQKRSFKKLLMLWQMLAGNNLRSQFSYQIYSCTLFIDTGAKSTLLRIHLECYLRCLKLSLVYG